MADIPSVHSEIGPWGIVPVWVLAHGLSGAEMAVYVALRSFSGAALGSNDTQNVFPHVATIAERAYVTVRTAEKAITKMRKAGLLTSTRRYSAQGWIRGCDYTLADIPVAPAMAYAWSVGGDSHPISRSPNPSANPSSKGPNRPNGRSHPVETDGGKTVQTDGAVSDQVKMTTEADQGTSSGGAHAMAHADARAREVQGQHLVHMRQRQLTQTLTGVWIAVCKEHGGEPPEQEPEGWGVEDTHVYTRGKHIIGSQIKEWVQLHSSPTVEELDAFLLDIREHAENWASSSRRAA